MEPLDALLAADPQNALESFGACNALRAADPQVHALRAAIIWFLQYLAGYRPTATLKPFWYWQALWPANAQMLWKMLWNHLVPCEQSATTLEPFGADIALRVATPQMLWSHLVIT